jgi:hypothetical protein
MNLKNGLAYIFLCSSMLLTSVVFCDEQNEDIIENNLSYNETKILNAWQNPHRIYLDHTEGNWLDNHQGYTSISFFSALPFLETSSFTPFIDVRGHFFNNGKNAANAGIGLRYQRDGSSNIFGVNAFYDFREASWNDDFHQVGIGFEYLSPCVDIRINTYLPICNSVGNSSTTTFRYPGGYIASAKKQRVSYGGADFEIGTWLKRMDTCDLFDLYGAIGSYYYAQRHHHRNEYGTQARLEAHFLKYFAFEIKGGFDEIHHGMAQGTLSIAIPLEYLFGGCRKDPCEAVCQKNDALYQSVNRQEIIALSQKQCCWKWNWDKPTIPCCD